MSELCPVCGWPELHEPPRCETGGASFEICPCCGFEFGFDDDAQGITYAQARTLWIAAGTPWWSNARPAPPGWNPTHQLARAGLA
jgi:hypothetical protein